MNSESETKLNITDGGGARTTSVYTERKTTVFAVSEPELDAISYFNTATTSFFSFGSYILSTFIDNARHIKSEDYRWYFDPLGWVTLLLFSLALFALVKKESMIKKIKKQSHIIS